ncbi:MULTISPECIES: beta-ketoacyl-[acyl-carrier-protein] synthase family protein [Streptomyces]|uniref:hypothetical protein n=1 Tax=Streptomyces TaxID=1883 RepID=UPI00163C49D4|nr:MULTISPECIES: hypothetical protein [Streptomyces]MBC2875509.1 hypothetical protein [Streptomyces sp. TYQ1024]UBI35747.1 hypothetical protein K7I03_04215 [Streptomyces mobaraensis]UKW28340.1 hypothetical protein MCU78_04230 [Streptomyces sp. TYQ1024]
MRIASAVGILAGALWLPAGRSTVEDAVVDGVLDDVLDAPPDVPEVPMTRGETPESMAAEAVRRALAAAGRPAAALDVLAYSWVLRTGRSALHSPPFRLAKELSVGDCAALGVVQACNGGAAAVETAVTRMLTDERIGLAAAVSSDSFEEFGSRRWTDPMMMVGGDGAAAVVLCRGPGRLALRSLVSRGHTCADIMEAGQDLRHRLPDGGARDNRRLAEAAHSVERFGACLASVVRDALDDADLDAADESITAVLLPRLAGPFTESFVRPALPAPLRKKAYVADPHTGHLGSGDALANLEYARRRAVVAPGEHLLVVNGGQGVAASCMVLTPGDG